MNAEIDVRHVLPTIHVSTLVLYRRDEFLRTAAHYMGERIPGARIVPLPGADHLPWEGAQENVLAEIARFVEELQGEPERSGLAFAEREQAPLQVTGVSGEWRVYALEG
jgi:hypothetical protein